MKTEVRIAWTIGFSISVMVILGLIIAAYEYPEVVAGFVALMVMIVTGFWSFNTIKKDRGG